MMLDRLLAGLFDYAGMFPPASLPFEEALAKSATFPRRLRRPGMLAADMVVTPVHLGALDDGALQDAGYDRDMDICLVGVPIDEGPRWAKHVTAFNERWPVRRIVSLELHGLHADEGTASYLSQTLRGLPTDVRPYFEPKWQDAAWEDGLDEVMQMLQGLPAGDVGLKVRCAGATAVSHETLAAVIQAVNTAGVPFKATQGLHHPLAGGVHGNVHGFLNLVVALRLQEALVLPHDHVVAILRDPLPEAFVFGDGLGWRGHRAMAQRVQEACTLPFSIGSCSLEEPDDDLAALFGPP